MYVRLAFAVAAHLEPDILIVDEVLAVGDAEFQKRCLGKMEEVARMGRTVLFVSHSMHAIEKLCSRVARFGGGRLLESGSPAPVVQNYLKAVSERRNVFPLRDSETGIVLESARSGLDSDNSPNGSPLCHGCDGFLEFVFSCPKDLGIAALHLGIYSDRGVLLALLDSSNGKRAFDWSRGRHCVRCMISQFPLLAGRYDCNLAIVRSGHAIAAFPLSFDLQVISGNATNNPKAGFISLDFRWEEVLVDSPA
jgi:lipopolysaccharide transport system ATP-binding protein